MAATRSIMLLDTTVLPTAAVAGQPGRLAKRYAIGDAQVVVRIHQPRAAADDAVAVGVGVAGEGDVEAVLQLDHARHGVGRRRVHADLAVPVDRHEAEGRVDRAVHHLEPQPVARGDGVPVGDAGAAERIDTEADRRAAHGVEIDHRAEVADVGVSR